MTPPAMPYAEARLLIRSGDLIAVRKRYGLLPTLTRWITRSPYTHTAIALWGELSGVDRLLAAEAKASGAFLTPLSQYAEVDFDVYNGPHGVSLYRLEQVIWAALGTPIAYD